MADWTQVPDTDVDPDAPVTSELMYALRDNPVALAEGALGAPKVVDAALSTTVTQAGQDWVANRIIAASWNAVGQYVLASGEATPRSPGYVALGSLLRPHNTGTTAAGAGTLPGSWRLQGRTQTGGSTPSNTSVWLRIS